MDTTMYIGIDVAKATLDSAARPGAEQWVAVNDEEGIAALVELLGALHPALVVLEATGGRELPVAALATAGLAVAVVNPRQVRDVARAVGQRAKTDALDAQLLARFAEVVHPTPCPLPHAQELSALLARRRQLVGMRVAERNRLDTATPPVRPRIQAHSAWLDDERADLDRALRDAVQASPLWRARDDLRCSVPGIGPATTLTLLAEVPRLGHLDHTAIAALAGVAPLACESGILRGRRVVWGGRARVRAVLSMAALVATRHNPTIRACYERLCAVGKPKNVALTACMHKLLLIANAILRHRTPWSAPAAARHPRQLLSFSFYYTRALLIAKIN